MKVERNGIWNSTTEHETASHAQTGARATIVVVIILSSTKQVQPQPALLFFASVRNGNSPGVELIMDWILINGSRTRLLIERAPRKVVLKAVKFIAVKIFSAVPHRDSQGSGDRYQLVRRGGCSE